MTSSTPSPERRPIVTAKPVKWKGAKKVVSVVGGVEGGFVADTRAYPKKPEVQP